MKRFVVPAVILAALVAGCAREKPAPAKAMTERERNETLAGEPLPGATVVGRALESNDVMDARNARMSAMVDSLPR
jgi:hypothetical protein